MKIFYLVSSLVRIIIMFIIGNQLLCSSNIWFNFISSSSSNFHIISSVHTFSFRYKNDMFLSLVCFKYLFWVEHASTFLAEMNGGLASHQLRCLWTWLSVCGVSNCCWRWCCYWRWCWGTLRGLVSCFFFRTQTMPMLSQFIVYAQRIQCWKCLLLRLPECPTEKVHSCST